MKTSVGNGISFGAGVNISIGEGVSVNLPVSVFIVLGRKGDVGIRSTKTSILLVNDGVLDVVEIATLLVIVGITMQNSKNK